MIPLYESSENGYLLDLDDLTKYMKKTNTVFENAFSNIAKANSINTEDISVLVNNIFLNEEEDQFVGYLMKKGVNVISRDIDTQIDECTSLELLTEASKASLESKRRKYELKIEQIDEKLKWWRSLSASEKQSEKNKSLMTKVIAAFFFGLVGVVSHNIYIKATKGTPAFKDYEFMLEKAKAGYERKN